MKTKNAITMLFPSIIMIIISVISFGNILNITELDIKGAFILCLVILFPLTYLAQGIVSALTKTNPYIGFIASTATYLVIMFLFMNSSALGYILYFSVIFVVGYFGTEFLLKLINKGRKEMLE